MVVQDVAEVFLASESLSSGNCIRVKLDVAKVRARQNGKDIAARVTNGKSEYSGKYQ